MSARHALGIEGSWVELRDFSELRYGDKKRVQAAVTDHTRLVPASNEMMDALMVLLIVSWNLSEDLPLPSQDPSVIDRLSLTEGNALEALIEPARELLFPGAAEPAKDEPAEAVQEALKDPAHPTVPSVD